MNILVPDQWLRDFLKTDATPKQLKEYLSLCGPSIERINTVNGEIVYDVEITSNRPDAMSIVGVAREASGILPRFGIAATLLDDPYTEKIHTEKKDYKKIPLTITTTEALNPRWTSVIFDDIKIGPSPSWLVKRLELVGVRTINNVIDITNYLMHAYGQPAHVFDLDTIHQGIMKLRPAKKGEQVTTLDGKTHTLPGGDIVIEDGSGNLIDLCGIMGGKSSSITDKTTRVLLFVQTYDPAQIRKTSMNLAHRTEAAGLFEKGLDPELVMPVFQKGIDLIKKLAGGNIVSEVTDIYSKPYKAKSVVAKRAKIDSYIGVHLETKEIQNILSNLGCKTKITENEVIVTPPSFRRDIELDVDIIEELARIYGYHKIPTKLPDTEPPTIYEEPILGIEQKIKQKLGDWGYTETYTYSMISKELLDLVHYDEQETYMITNPISNDWVYMRPTLLPSMLMAIKQNTSFEQDLKLFELSMTYAYRKNNIPLEESTLIVAVSGSRYGKIKGIAESLFTLFGIPLPEMTEPANSSYQKSRSLRLGIYGQLGEIDLAVLQQLGIPKPVTMLELSIDRLLEHKKSVTHYTPIPKYPASFEDLAFVVPEKTHVAPMMKKIQTIDPMIKDVSLFDSYKNIRTFHVTYQSSTQNLTKEEINRIREKIISQMKKEFGATLKN